MSAKIDKLPSSLYKSRDLNVGTLDSSIKMHQNMLKRHLSKPLRKWFRNTYDNGVKWAEEQNLSGRHIDLRVFQETLREVPKWNTEQITDECKQITDYASPQFRLQKTLKILFISKSMILAAIRPMSAENDELEIDVPSTDTYIHKVLCLCSECFFQYPSLFRHAPNDTEDKMEKNNRLVRETIDECLIDAITDLLPCAEIVDKYLEQEMEAKAFVPIDENNTQPLPSSVSDSQPESKSSTQKLENPSDVKEITVVNPDEVDENTDSDYDFDESDDEQSTSGSGSSESSESESKHAESVNPMAETTDKDDKKKYKSRKTNQDVVDSKMAAKRAAFAAKKARKEAIKAKKAADGAIKTTNEQ